MQCDFVVDYDDDDAEYSCCMDFNDSESVDTVGNWSRSNIHAINTCPEHINVAAMHRPQHCVWLRLSTLRCVPATHTGM